MTCQGRKYTGNEKTTDMKVMDGEEQVNGEHRHWFFYCCQNLKKII